MPHNKTATTDGKFALGEGFNSWSQQAYHHEDSYYYARPDVYNLRSNRFNGQYIISNWQSHVQNMGSTCGVCSLINIMNHLGFDTMSEDSIFNEATVASDYEIHNSTYIQGSGTGVPNFTKLLTDNTKYSSVINLKASNRSTGFGTDSKSIQETNLAFKTYEDFAPIVKSYIENGTAMSVSWKPCHGHWTTIIGFMDFDNDNPNDDLIIMGDSSDYRDHYFDGYDVHPAKTFFNRWTNSSNTVLQAYLVIEKK